MGITVNVIDTRPQSTRGSAGLDTQMCEQAVTASAFGGINDKDTK